MSKIGKVLIVLAVVVGLIAFVMVSSVIGIHNSALVKKNRVTAKQTDNVQILGTIQTILKEKTGVTLEGFERYSELQKAVMEARYDSGGSLAKFITENGGNAEKAMEGFNDLSRSIEAQFTRLSDEQSLLLQYDKDYDDFRGAAVASFVLNTFYGGKFPEELEITVVKTAQAQEDFATGTLSELDLMGRGKNQSPTPAEKVEEVPQVDSE